MPGTLWRGTTAACFHAEQTISIPSALPVWGATISTHLGLRAYALVVGRLRNYLEVTFSIGITD